MCGIVGFYSYRGNISLSKEMLNTMTNSMSHRGPDDSGCVLFEKAKKIPSAFKNITDSTKISEGFAGLGHRRLSIIDLSKRGHQPMSAEGGLVWMVYNGEVYNYIELREELEAKGYDFNSTTDSEVVLKSYLEWGTDCFERFNGMWAIGIYDLRTDIVILSRDRFGKKPLYYYKNSDFLLFASEIKAILIHPLVRKEMNLKKVVDYAGRHYRYVDCDNESFFKDIFHVPKSSYMVFRKTGEEVVRRYWELKEAPLLGDTKSEGEIVERFGWLLKDAVSIRLRSDVPVGCMLSGGLDSGSITCIAASQNNDFITFSGITGKGYYDESEYINEILRHTGVKSRYIYPGADALFPTLKEMLGFHDEPVCTVTWYSNYIITKQIPQYHVPVVLTGHGGDELLAGYWDHYHYNFSDMRINGRDDSEEFNSWLHNHKRPADEYKREKEYIEKLHANNSIEVDKYSQYLSALSPDILSYTACSNFFSPFKGDLTRRLYLELFYETVPPSLRAEDRNMMAFSIENRLPFLDYRLAEFSFRLDNKYKIRNGLGKWLLREAMKGVMPDKVRLRTDKTGFNAPFDEWIRNENRKQLEDIIYSKNFMNTEIYSIDKVKELFDEHLIGRNHYMFFWQYINLNLWYEQHFK